MKRIYVDIDGTLTDAPTKRWGQPKQDRIDCLKQLIAAGYEVMLWSASGRRYAEHFAHKYNIKPFICLGKPQVIVDDNPNIRPKKRMPVVDPDFLVRLFKEVKEKR